MVKPVLFEPRAKSIMTLLTDQIGMVRITIAGYVQVLSHEWWMNFWDHVMIENKISDKMLRQLKNAVIQWLMSCQTASITNVITYS